MPEEYKRYYRLIPEEYREKNDNDYEKALNISMWISSMTDRYAVELFKNLNGIELPRY
jgi:dGTP triphosphohydrolase